MASGPEAGAPGPLPICIALATRDGARHLGAQLDSYLAQDWPDWILRASDDGSTDGTRAILDRFAAGQPPGRVAWQVGPCRGVGVNFLTLLARVTAERPDAAVAFSDQDDVWLPHKLSAAATWMQAQGADRGEPLVWCSRAVLTDADLVPFAETRHFPRPPAFGNALVQNILHGATIVLSPAAARILAATVPAALAAGVPYQDWWTYQVMTGIGAGLHFAPEPSMLYRQHGANHMGHHGPVAGRLRRLHLIAGGTYAGWIDAHLAALTAHDGILTAGARDMLRDFAEARRQGGRRLAAALPRLGIHRQTPRGDAVLRAMALAGRL